AARPNFMTRPAVRMWWPSSAMAVMLYAAPASSCASPPEIASSFDLSRKHEALMPLGELAAILFVAGIVMLVAELLLVTHGLMGLLGCLSLLSGVVVCFFINEWLGIGSLVACIAAAPIVGGWLV